MILNVSGRTDIVAFYSQWFWNRYQEGYVDVRNPFYPKQVSRIYFEDVDAILFCTKNPVPILQYLPKIKQPILFHVTITPYQKDIEPNVSPKGRMIAAIRRLSEIVGKENLYIRYDPILINEIYTIDYHIRAFEHLCDRLDGFVTHIIISFVDEYKNVRNHQKDLKLLSMSEEDYERIGHSFMKSATQHHMTIQTCCEEHNLVAYGFQKQECLGGNLAFRLTGKTDFKLWNARKCRCVEMVDIGSYNTCCHFCRYCYANYDEKVVLHNCKQHDPCSSLLIGHIKEEDQVKRRK